MRRLEAFQRFQLGDCHFVLYSTVLACIEATEGNFANLFWSLKEQLENLNLLQKPFSYCRTVFGPRTSLTAAHYLATKARQQSESTSVNTQSAMEYRSPFASVNIDECLELIQRAKHDCSELCQLVIFC